MLHCFVSVYEKSSVTGIYKHPMNSPCFVVQFVMKSFLIVL